MTEPTPDTTYGAKPIVRTGDLVVGTVVSFAGPADEGELYMEGWLPCDGRELNRADYDPLFQVIGTLHGGGDGVRKFRLPDYRGWFLRGVDNRAGRDPDAASRTAAAPGGQTGDNCGSAQRHATAPPRMPFVLSQDGAHTHEAPNIPDDRSCYYNPGLATAEWNDGFVDTGSAGAHGHEVIDGDPESRPVNAYVSYLIKFRA